jgi:hypothetical protein
MNYLWIITFTFAFCAMLFLSHKIEKQLLALKHKQCQNYTYKVVNENSYLITPCPANYVILENLSNVVWVARDSDNLLIKAESRQAIEDLIIALNSTYF